MQPIHIQAVACAFNATPRCSARITFTGCGVSAQRRMHGVRTVNLARAASCTNARGALVNERVRERLQSALILLA